MQVEQNREDFLRRLGMFVLQTLVGTRCSLLYVVQDGQLLAP